MVTQALDEALLPAESVAVSVTRLGPSSAQVKKLGETERDAIPQLSEEAESTCSGRSVTEPLEPGLKIMSLLTTVGATLSLTH